MLFALTWTVVLLLIALWSLLVWALHATTAWTVANVGVMASGSAAIEAWRMPDWLAPWVGPEFAVAFKSMLTSIAPTIEAVLNQAPALGDGLSVASWVIWGIGSAFLVILGLVLSGLIAAMRRRKPATVVTARDRATAG